MYYPARACQDCKATIIWQFINWSRHKEGNSISVLLWASPVNSQVFLSTGLG